MNMGSAEEETVKVDRVYKGAIYSDRETWK